MADTRYKIKCIQVLCTEIMEMMALALAVLIIQAPGKNPCGYCGHRNQSKYNAKSCHEIIHTNTLYSPENLYRAVRL